MWIRDTYTELEQYLIEKYQNVFDTRDARSYLDSLLHRMYILRTGEEQVATGSTLQSKWRRRVCDAVLAMSGVSESSMATTVEWLTADEMNFDVKRVLAILHGLEKKDRVTKIFRFTMEQLSVLCTHPSPDSAAPPDPDGDITIHLFGDATALLRSQQRHYNFTENTSRTWS